jgi:hypothetical protein
MRAPMHLQPPVGRLRRALRRPLFRLGLLPISPFLTTNRHAHDPQCSALTGTATSLPVIAPRWIAPQILPGQRNPPATQRAYKSDFACSERRAASAKPSYIRARSRLPAWSPPFAATMASTLLEVAAAFFAGAVPSVRRHKSLWSGAPCDFASPARPQPNSRVAL